MPIYMHSSIWVFLSALEAWAKKQPDILAVAIIGSHAKGMAGPDSDIDIVIIADDPDRYSETSSWLECFGRIRSISNEDWGLLQSRRVHYLAGLEVEFGITNRKWAHTHPIDPGTKRVVSDGMRILHDPEDLLQSLITQAQQPSH
jgi:uncharacterized protein